MASVSLHQFTRDRASANRVALVITASQQPCTMTVANGLRITIHPRPPLAAVNNTTGAIAGDNSERTVRADSSRSRPGHHGNQNAELLDRRGGEQES
jgi:hypothetical protein